MNDEFAAGREVLGADEAQAVLILPGVVQAWLEDAGADVHATHGTRIGAGELMPQRYQAADMIIVVVRQDDVVHVRQIDMQGPGVPKHQVGGGARVVENPVPVDLDQCRVAPLAVARMRVAADIGDQHGDLQRVHVMGSGGLVSGSCRCETASCQREQRGRQLCYRRAHERQRWFTAIGMTARNCVQ